MLVINPKIAGTSFTSTAALTVGHRYTWYIGAIDANGDIFFSAPNLFTLNP